MCLAQRLLLRSTRINLPKRTGGPHWIAEVATVVCATLGGNTLHSWDLSIGALILTAGIVLFMVALGPVLEQYAPRGSTPEGPPPSATVSSLAFSPLAFPTIVTPYGIAVLIVLVTLAEGDVSQVGLVLGTAAVVLVLDLIVMLFADHILEAPLLGSALGIMAAVMGLLQVAPGVQTIINGLRMLGVWASTR